MANPVLQKDPYTSYPTDPLSALTPGYYDYRNTTYQKPTPILNLFSKIIHWTIGTLSSALGYDDENHQLFSFLGGGGGGNGHRDTASSVIGKRQLDTTGIVEACMIPVLVALSGTFAGLTLGYVLSQLIVIVTLRSLIGLRRGVYDPQVEKGMADERFIQILLH